MANRPPYPDPMNVPGGADGSNRLPSGATRFNHQ